MCGNFGNQYYLFLYGEIQSSTCNDVRANYLQAIQSNSTSRYFNMSYITNSNGNSRGFNLSYEIWDCGECILRNFEYHHAEVVFC